MRYNVPEVIFYGFGKQRLTFDYYSNFNGKQYNVMDLYYNENLFPLSEIGLANNWA